MKNQLLLVCFSLPRQFIMEVGPHDKNSTSIGKNPALSFLFYESIGVAESEMN